MREVQPRLGRGLAMLLGQTESEPSRLRNVPIDQLEPNPFQPRATIPAQQLAELAQSIRSQGVLQPLLVRDTAAGTLQLVAGERRWRAAREAGLAEVPCLVLVLSDSDAALVALAENLQRQDLGPLEEAEGYRRMSEQFGLRQDQLAQAVGKSRSHVANTMRLLNLPPEVQAHVREGRLTAGHARALLAHIDPSAAARTVIERDLNVRQTEALSSPVAADRTPAASRNADVFALQEELSSHLGLRVSITNRNGAGQVAIQYGSLDQLEGLISLLKAS
jgi:ParB family chromosome partitioning protein